MDREDWPQSSHICVVGVCLSCFKKKKEMGRIERRHLFYTDTWYIARGICFYNNLRNFSWKALYALYHTVTYPEICFEVWSVFLLTNLHILRVERNQNLKVWSLILPGELHVWVEIMFLWPNNISVNGWEFKYIPGRWYYYWIQRIKLTGFLIVCI